MKTYYSFEVTCENFSINRGLNYGDGLFETILLHNGSMPLWLLHLQRLQTGLQQLGMKKLSGEFLLDKINQLRGNQQHGIVKLLVFRSGEQRGYGNISLKSDFIITLNSLKNVNHSANLGLSSIVLSSQKKLAGLKHLNRLEQVLAANELIKTAFTDAIMLDKKKRVIETVSKNIVLIKKNKLYTPRLNKSGVYGVALRWLESQGFNLNWKKIEIKSLHKYDAFLVCNSIRGFSPIHTITNKFQFKVSMPLIDEIQNRWNNTLNL